MERLSKNQTYSNSKVVEFDGFKNKDILTKSERGAEEVTQYLITTFTDSSGLPHNHVTKARENQTFTVVEAESKEEALKKYEEADNE